MDGLLDNLPTESDALVALLLQQQQLHEQQQRLHKKELASSQERNKQLQKNVQTKTLTIEKLEERLRALLILQFGKKSERFNPDQFPGTSTSQACPLVYRRQRGVPTDDQSIDGYVF